MGPANRNDDKLSVGDIVVFVLFFGMAIFLIPFYSSIFEVLKQAGQMTVGVNTYLGIFGVIFGFFLFSLGIRNRNNAIKIFSLCLTFFFLLFPFYGYFSNRTYFKETLGDYKFGKIVIVQPDDCELIKEAQQNISDKLTNQFGNDLDFDVEVDYSYSNYVTSNTSYKQRIACMPSKTHYVYKLTYKDVYGSERTILYDGKENFDVLLVVSSYEIMNDEVGTFLMEEANVEHGSYQFKIYSNGSGLVPLTRKNSVSEKLHLPYPSVISLNNFYKDKRLVLDVEFFDRETAYQTIEKLWSESGSQFPVIIHYGKNTEYYFEGTWYRESEQQLFERMKGIFS